MATKTVTLDPGESQKAAFIFTPHVAKVHAVSVDGLSGSFEAVAMADLYGRVRDTIDWSILLPGVRAIINSQESYTDSGGNFSFLGLMPGPYTITLEKEGYETLTQEIELSPGYNEMFFNLTPVAVEQAYFTVSPEWAEMNCNKPEYICRFTISNTGNKRGTQDVKWWIMEYYKTIDSGSWPISLEPGESISKSIVVPHPGTPGQGYVEDRSALVRTEQMDGRYIIHFY